jgi:hypothetical protein
MSSAILSSLSFEAALPEMALGGRLARKELFAMKIRLHSLLALCFSLLALFGSQLVGFSPAHAASVSTDPLVVIAVDVTAQSNCNLTKTVNLGHSHAYTVHRPCVPGTIMMSQVVPLSHAVATHERYVRLSSSHASLEVLEQTDRAIENVMTSVGVIIRQSSGKEISAIPQIPCGTYSTISVYWYPDSDSLASGVRYYKYQNCTNIAIDNSSIHGYTSPNALWWDHDQYASGWWGTGCPYIGTNDLGHDINSTQPAGYYFEPWVKNSQCIPEVGTFWYTNIGPLN